MGLVEVVIGNNFMRMCFLQEEGTSQRPQDSGVPSGREGRGASSSAGTWERKLHSEGTRFRGATPYQTMSWRPLDFSLRKYQSRSNQGQGVEGVEQQ